MTLVGSMFRKGDTAFLCVDSHERPFVMLKDLSSDQQVKVFLEDLKKEGYDRLIGGEEGSSLIDEAVKKAVEDLTTGKIIDKLLQIPPTQDTTDEQHPT